MAQVLESRVDHTRVVLMLRKAGNLPLVKDYLMAVQKSNLSAVNEAVNELLIEEEDFEVRIALSSGPWRHDWHLGTKSSGRGLLGRPWKIAHVTRISV